MAGKQYIVNVSRNNYFTLHSYITLQYYEEQLFCMSKNQLSRWIPKIRGC